MSLSLYTDPLKTDSNLSRFLASRNYIVNIFKVSLEYSLKDQNIREPGMCANMYSVESDQQKECNSSNK